jgi:hypothetical protein
MGRGPTRHPRALPEADCDRTPRSRVQPRATCRLCCRVPSMHRLIPAALSWSRSPASLRSAPRHPSQALLYAESPPRRTERLAPPRRSTPRHCAKLPEPPRARHPPPQASDLTPEAAARHRLHPPLSAPPAPASSDPSPAPPTPLRALHEHQIPRQPDHWRLPPLFQPDAGQIRRRHCAAIQGLDPVTS